MEKENRGYGNVCIHVSLCRNNLFPNVSMR